MKKLGTPFALYRTLHSIMVLGMVVFIATACSDINTSEPASGKAHMNVSLTDAPASYQEVNVDVQGVRIYYTPVTDDTANADSTDGGWIDLEVEPTVINLLDLSNGVDTLLASADLDPGRYQELRLVLGSENTVMADSVIHDLKVPSGQQSGYKIKFDAMLEAGDEINVVVDFDAASSVHAAGNSGQYILKPVLKAFVEDGEEAEAGSIAGSVMPIDAEPNIFAIMGDDTTSTQTDDEGGFMIQGLDDGMYDLLIQSTNEQYSDTTLTDVSVNENEEANVGVITLSESQ